MQGPAEEKQTGWVSPAPSLPSLKTPPLPPSRGWVRNLTFCEGFPLVQLAHELLGVKGCTLHGSGVWLLRGAGLRWGDTEESKLGRKMGVWVRAGFGE